MNDLRYCLRSLARTPGFTATVILTLAVGIGANTAIFSIVDAVLLRPLPFRQPDQLVRVVDNAPGVNARDIGMSVPELDDLQHGAGVFESVAGVWPIDGNSTGGGRPERIEALAISFNYFELLRVKPRLGRLIDSRDRTNGFADACVISYDFWQRNFAGDPHVLGKTLREDGDAYTIVGVTPKGFRHPGRTLSTDVDMWAATTFSGDPFPADPQRSSNYIPGAIARLKPGLTVAQAQQRLDTFVAQLRAQYPRDYRPETRFSIQLEPLKDALTGNVRTLLLILLGAVGMMLLIGCFNIANLLLARAAGRQREIAVRQAMGASRWRLVRQMLTESLLLSFAAGFAGVIGAVASLRLLLDLAPSRLPRLAEISIDARVLVFAVAVCVFTGVAFGLAPALQTPAIELAGRLREGGRGAGSSRRQALATAALVTAEFAICLILMTGAGLLVRSFWNLTHADPGFNPHNAMVVRIWLPQPNNPHNDPYARVQDRAIFIREALRRARTLPGVAAAAMSTSFPMGARGVPNPVTVEGRAAGSQDSTLAEVVSVSPDYFRLLGAPQVEGRSFSDLDQLGSALVGEVDRDTATRFWPGESPVGKRIKLGRRQSANPWVTIVGVVGSIRHDGMDADPVPHLYLSLWQRAGKVLALEVRTAGAPSSLAEPLRREIQAIDPNLPVFGIATFDRLIQTSLASHRFSAELMAVFAVLALLLAALGAYGVLAYFVGQRTREIGVRMALGAKAGSVVRMVAVQGVRPAILGTAMGLAASLLLGRLLATLLYGVSVSDPLVFVAAPAALLATAVAACAIPARRATRIDPLEALRYE
jgi:predicted permease